MIERREEEKSATPISAGRELFARFLRMRKKSAIPNNDERIGATRYQIAGVYLPTPTTKITNDASGWLLSWCRVSRMFHGLCIPETRSSEMSSSNRSSVFAAAAILKSIPQRIMLGSA